jgi:hypothetical protein
MVNIQLVDEKHWRITNQCSTTSNSAGLIYYKRNAKVITHADLQDGHNALFADDGVHLSFLGNDIFINAVQCLILP